MAQLGRQTLSNRKWKLYSFRLIKLSLIEKGVFLTYKSTPTDKAKCFNYVTCLIKLLHELIH